MTSMFEMAKPAASDNARWVALMERISYLWCRHMHNAVMWPIHGAYRCRVCHRQFPVAWEQGGLLHDRLQMDQSRTRWKANAVSVGTS